MWKNQICNWASENALMVEKWILDKIERILGDERRMGRCRGARCSAENRSLCSKIKFEGANLSEGLIQLAKCWNYYFKTNENFRSNATSLQLEIIIPMIFSYFESLIWKLSVFTQYSPCLRLRYSLAKVLQMRWICDLCRSSVSSKLFPSQH